MVLDATAVHYPGIPAAEVGVGSITPATLTLARTAGPLQFPTDKVWFGAEGITGPVAGIVQSVSLSETVQVQEEADSTGDIVACVLHAYKATAQMEILTAAAVPALGTTLTVFGAFKITSAEEKWSKGAMRSISIEGILIPGVV